MASSRARALSALLVALAVAGGARADGEEPADCARAVAERVQTRYEGVRELEARFTQRSRSAALGNAAQEMEARGVALFAKPGRMRWTYEAPEPSVVVSDGKTLWIYDPVAKEAQEFPAGEGFLSGTAVQFLLGEGKILEAFEVRDEGCGGETVRLHLRPRAEATYESLELLVVPETGDIRESAVVDLFGNRTDVRFVSVRVNPKLDPAQFRFEPATDVRVLRVAPPPGGSDSQ
jgi:outer membrane lipoprotein carrier protein